MSEFCILKLGLGMWSYLESRAPFVIFRVAAHRVIATINKAVGYSEHFKIELLF